MSETAPFHTPIAMLKTVDRDGYDLSTQPSPVLRGYTQPIGTIGDEKHAKFIVTAVNSHAALVESVTNLLSLVKAHTGADDAVANTAVREARAALSLAKGETKETGEERWKPSI